MIIFLRAVVSNLRKYKNIDDEIWEQEMKNKRIKAIQQTTFTNPSIRTATITTNNESTSVDITQVRQTKTTKVSTQITI